MVSDCITTPTFSITVNSIPKGHVSSNKGIGQGDTLSPYLFVVAMEYFSLQIEIVEHNKLFQTIYNF